MNSITCRRQNLVCKLEFKTFLLDLHTNTALLVVKYCTNAMTEAHLHQKKLKHISSEFIPDVKKICIDQILGKYHCILRKNVSEASPRQTSVISSENSCGVLRGSPRKVFQILPSFNIDNSICSS